jgi:lysophospholipase L1-like esterase
MVENGWDLHLDRELYFVNKSDELLVLMLGDNLKVAMLWLAAYLGAVGVAVAALLRCFVAAAILPSQPAAAGSQVVFLGDSIIARMDVSAVAPSAVNMGVGGDTTAAILARVGEVPVDATAIVLEGGINDLDHGWSEDRVLANYQKILERLLGATRIYLVGVLPLDETHLSQERRELFDNRKIAEVNTDLATLCRRYPNCVVIPPLPALGPSDTRGDGIHPNAAGYAKITMEWRAILRNH